MIRAAAQFIPPRDSGEGGTARLRGGRGAPSTMHRCARMVPLPRSVSLRGGGQTVSFSRRTSFSSPPGLTRWSMLSCGSETLSENSVKLPFRMDCRVKFTAGPATSGRTRLPGNDDVKMRSRDAMHPRFAHNQATKRSGRICVVYETTLFDSPPAIKGSGAPKGALSNQCPRKARGGALLTVRRARLSAPTLAALTTGSARWLSSRTGFPAGFG